MRLFSENMKALLDSLGDESKRLRLSELIGKDEKDSVTDEPLTCEKARELPCGHVFLITTLRRLEGPYHSKKCPLCRAEFRLCQVL
jgi:hypothetical protein